MIIPYLCSYFYLGDEGIRNSDFLIIGPISMIAETVVSVVAVQRKNKCVSYEMIIFGIVVSTVIIFASSFVKRPFWFCLIFGVGLGYLSGITFLPVLMILWNAIKKNQEKYTALALIGYAIGPIPFGLFFTILVNPYNSSANRIADDGEELESMYDETVSNRVPMTIRWFSVALLITAISGMLLIPRKRCETTSKVTIHTMDMPEMLENKTFWNLFFMLFNAFSAFGYIQSVYKIVGNLYIQNDFFLSVIGCFAFAFGAAGRVIYNIWLQQHNSRYIMLLTYSFYSIFMCSFWCTVHSKGLFAFYVLGFTFLAGSFYSSVILLANQAFAQDFWIFSYIGIAFIPASAMPFVIGKWITPVIGYFWTMVLNTGFTVVAIFQVALHPENKPLITISRLEELTK